MEFLLVLLIIMGTLKVGKKKEFGIIGSLFVMSSSPKKGGPSIQDIYCVIFVSLFVIKDVRNLMNVDNLSKPWQKFFKKFDEINSLAPAYWKEIHFLAYLTNKYKDHYQVPFAFSFKGAPGKCQEMVLIKKMCAMLQTSNPLKIKEYIDWAFYNRIIPNKLKIKTIAYFMTPGLGNEFNFYWEEKRKITKNTPLPNEYLELANRYDLSLTNYNDLIFIHSALQQDAESESRQPYKQYMSELTNLGFDSEILERIT